MFGRTADGAEPDNYIGPFTTNQTITDDDVDVVGVDTSGGAVTITLGTDIVEEGKHIYIKDVGGAGGTNAITINTEGSETVDGGTSISVSANYGAAELVVDDSSNWWSIGAVGGGTL